MARTNSQVLVALRRKLAKPGEQPVSRQAIQQRRARFQARVPMPTDIATYVVAQREGVPLHTHLDAETLEQVASAEQRLSTKERGEDIASAAERRNRVKADTRPAIVREVHLDGIKVPDAALSGLRKMEAARMAAVYPVLYGFENSVREFVDGHLAAVIGTNWWDDAKLVSRTIRDTVERNRAAEGRNRYHSRRNARPIYYTNLGDLPVITASEKAWPVFKKLFPSDKWLPGIVEKIEASRNVVAHMNPLQKRDVDRIRIGFEDWLAQIRGHEPAVLNR